jgi:predicted RNase H-like HicB family nuclease
MKPHDYAVQIVWSNEDQAYLASAFELAGCMADGQSPEEALSNLRCVITEWLEIAKEEDRKIPAPMSTEDFEKLAAKQNEVLRNQVQDAANAAAKAAIEHFLQDWASHFSDPWENRMHGFGISRISLEPTGFGRR